MLDTQIKGRSMELTTSFLLNQQTQINGQSNDIVTLRHRLIQLNVWPAAADEFLALLSVSRWHMLPVTEEDKKWMLQVADDSLKGIDIGCRYPAFFQKLLTNGTLCRAFLQELEKKMNPS